MNDISPLGILTRSLEKEKAANGTKSRFLGIVSHGATPFSLLSSLRFFVWDHETLTVVFFHVEMRTPLTTILGWMEILLKDDISSDLRSKMKVPLPHLILPLKISPRNIVYIFEFRLSRTAASTCWRSSMTSWTFPIWSMESSNWKTTSSTWYQSFSVELYHISSSFYSHSFNSLRQSIPQSKLFTQ